MATSTVERPLKHILVTLYYRGRTHWAMVAARKVGRHYEISSDAISVLQSGANVHPYTSFSFG